MLHRAWTRYNIHKDYKRYRGAPPWWSAVLGKYEILTLVYAQKIYFQSFCVCLKSKTNFICQFSPSSSQQLFKNIRELWPKKNLQTIEQLIKFCCSLLQKEVSLVYSFSKQVAVKGNFSESAWWMQPPVYLHIIKITWSSGQKPV